MDAHYVADRSLLLALWQQHPEGTNPTLAQATGRSLAWVKKWKARFRAHPDDPDVIWGRTRASSSASAFVPRVIEQILAIRDSPPEQLQRTPGPRAILSFLPRSPAVEGQRLPRATRTIWKILRAHNRIPQHRRRPRGAQARPEPLVEPSAIARMWCRSIRSPPPNRPTRWQSWMPSMSARRSGSWVSPVPPLRPQRSLRRCSTCWSRSACPSGCALTAIRAFWAAPACATFQRPSCGSGTRWACSRWSIRPADRTSTPSSSGCTPPWSTNIGRRGARISADLPARLAGDDAGESAALPAALHYPAPPPGRDLRQSSTRQRPSPAPAPAALAGPGRSGSLARGTSCAVFCSACQSQWLRAPR